MAQSNPTRSRLTTAEYAKLAAFRYTLRSFLHFSETAAAALGLTGQQYQAMLFVRSRQEGPPISIADLAKELLIKHNSAVGLADRLVAQELMVRERVPEDRRTARLRLTAKGERILGQLARVHRAKLRRMSPDIHRILEGLSAAWKERK